MTPANDPIATKHDPLKLLECIDKLEVGPVRLETHRVRATYRLTRGNKTESVDLIYSFKEKVFDPKDPTSLNLASMMVAQVAINYGQFCREIHFCGYYDTADRQFITEAMKNTAREIYVKKILQHNPFVVGPVKDLPLIKRSNYMRARLVFEPQRVTLCGTSSSRNKSSANATVSKSQNKLPDPWPMDPNRYTVLSSGGKESLLSYCLLEEVGCEVHPVFVVESGRHWYTAINSYRAFNREKPHTTKVWTNVDRVMCWLERRLSFIRPDFHNSPSDEYPVRLWTLPLFLFGVLPIARARGIGRVLIGDEFDTSRKYRHQGIPHYDGLYDQSLYFDNFMSRYYKKKGWGLTQFSVVRPMSELLVEKILVKRYPDIQQHQVSCHATHIENGRVKPCGNCEKCRRIVGMMLALGEDPMRCGFSKAQIQAILKALPGQSFRQASADAQHMAYLLRKRGLYPKTATGAKEHKEVVQLRFDADRSPMRCTPVHLREPIWKICLCYAEGAAIMQRRTWTKFNPLSHPDRKRPYPFD